MRKANTSLSMSVLYTTLNHYCQCAFYGPLIINMKLGEKNTYMQTGTITNFHIKPSRAFRAICVKGKMHKWPAASRHF